MVMHACLRLVSDEIIDSQYIRNSYIQIFFVLYHSSKTNLARLPELFIGYIGPQSALSDI